MHRLSARLNMGIALLMLPLLVLMPLLHGHPLGAVAGDHPVGLHFPMASGPVVGGRAHAGGGASSISPGPGAAAEGGAPATIVVQESRPRASSRGPSLRHSAFISIVPGPVVMALVGDRVRPATPASVARPQPWLHQQRAQAPPPPPGAAAVAVDAVVAVIAVVAAVAG
jgi:hypothetical protein